jgi:hypothetical protein
MRLAGGAAADSATRAISGRCPCSSTSPGARAHYYRRRQQGEIYPAAAPHLANRFFGMLYHCLQKRISYDEAKAFPSDAEIGT